MHKLPSILTLVTALLMAAALVACGGGSPDASSAGAGASNNTGSGNAGSTGSSGSSSGSSLTTTIPTGTTHITATYAFGSAEAQVFSSVNAYRSQCGFPAYQQNTILDQAAANHAKYMVANGGTVTDEEMQGNPGFTGITGQDRADALGWPSAVFATAADAGLWTSDALTPAQYGHSLVDQWSVGVYHQVVITLQANLIGVGAAQTSANGLAGALGGVELATNSATPSPITSSSAAPLTFPCQGVIGLPYKSVSEQPAPPNVSADGWGTPVTVMGNVGDVVTLSSATMLAAGDSNPITLNILTKATDTTSLIGQYQAVAYPANPLQPNTSYSVNLAGTINGTPFTRSFTFTTGSTVG